MLFTCVLKKISLAEKKAFISLESKSSDSGK